MNKNRYDEENIIEESVMIQAKIQGFVMALTKKGLNSNDMPFKEQLFIQEVAEIVMRKMAENDVTYFDDVTECEYINEVLNAILKDDDLDGEREEVFELIYDNLNFMIAYFFNNA